MEDNIKFKKKTAQKKRGKKGRRPQKKWKTNQSTKIDLIGCDTIVNSPSSFLCFVIVCLSMFYSSYLSMSQIINILISCLTTSCPCCSHCKYSLFLESYFFVPNLQEGYQLSVSYLVVSSKNGKKQDITMRLRDPKRILVTYKEVGLLEAIQQESGVAV